MRLLTNQRLKFISLTLLFTCTLTLLQLHVWTNRADDIETLPDIATADAAYYQASVFPDEPEDSEWRTLELLRIYRSVKNELVLLETQRHRLSDSVSQLHRQIEQTRATLQQTSKHLLRLQMTVDSYKISISKHTQPVFDELPSCKLLPMQFPQSKECPSQSPHLSSKPSSQKPCTMSSCFTWLPCELSKGYLRVCTSEPSEKQRSLLSHDSIDMLSALKQSTHFVASCKEACLRVVWGADDLKQHCIPPVSGTIEPVMPSCLAVFPDSLTQANISMGFEGHHTSSFYRVMLASSNFDPSLISLLSHRPGFDLLLAVPPLWPNTVPFRLLPPRRSYLLGATVGTTKQVGQSYTAFLLALLTRTPGHRSRIDLSTTENDRQRCWPSGSPTDADENWIPCENAAEVVGNSTFCLLVTPHFNTTTADQTTHTLGLQYQLSVCLVTGSIPVLVVDDEHLPLSLSLPFFEALEASWQQSVVMIPLPRAQELPEILLSIPDVEIVEIRRQGQNLWNTYLATAEARLATMLLIVSRRLSYPQPPALSSPARPLFQSVDGKLSHSPQQHYTVRTQVVSQVDVDDALGPLGPVHDSSDFQLRLTGLPGTALIVRSTQSASINPFWLHPSTPWDPFLPSEIQFTSATNLDFRPINHTVNKAGFEFSWNLGGMRPYEQFTLVILCYNRTNVALVTLEGMHQLPYLHSILVVWNYPEAPPLDLRWPKLHVPIHVVQGNKNSLNNRFLPFELIKTEAILTLDDDVQLRHDEIIFAFRVWRENRDRIVGFPARAHFWSPSEKQWVYNSDYTCEISMILTGAAFIHKYYFYAYTWEMSHKIRDHVDVEMNCEDIAMNFLVSHITRKPPLKVTTHWSFICHGCDTTLYSRPSHKTSRSICINKFSEIYGYNPLIYSQYRADSILFKTRIPYNKQKCFKYV